jgi:cell wall-associated NlpC family hydrolase
MFATLQHETVTARRRRSSIRRVPGEFPSWRASGTSVAAVRYLFADCARRTGSRNPFQSSMIEFRDYPFAPLLILVGGLVLVGCASTGRFPPPGPQTSGAVTQPAGADHAPASRYEIAYPAAPAVQHAVLRRLSSAHQAWDGTPYLYGGTSRSGIDCSAFTQQVLAESFSVRISRTTATQVHEGREVAREELQPGDLVFFRTGARSRHVGIYLSNGRFLHSGTRQGVAVDDLNSGFYDRTFWTARRVIPPRTLAALVGSTPPEDYAPTASAPASRPSETIPALIPEASGPRPSETQSPPTRSTARPERVGW